VPNTPAAANPTQPKKFPETFAANDSYIDSWTYQYDTLNRLLGATHANYQGSGVDVNGTFYTQQCWAYDGFGDRTFELESNSACPATLSSGNCTNWWSYTGTTANSNTNKITNSKSLTNGPAYDAAGNVTQDSLNTYLYDAEGRLCATQRSGGGSAWQYIYDAEGQRVAKGQLSGTFPSACPAPTTANNFTLAASYLRGASGTQDTELDWYYPNQLMGWNQNVYADSGLLASYSYAIPQAQQQGAPQPSPALTFHFNDWLGTKRLDVNAAGQMVTWWSSDPFGAYLTPFGSATDVTEQHFTGKERDAESSNDYFGARYYASSMGRFMSPDPSELLYADITNPQSFNLYSYVRNNPLKFVDPSGLYCAWEDGTSDSDPENGGASEADCNSQGGHWTDQHNPCDQAGAGDGCVATFDWNPPLPTQNASLGNYYYFGSFFGPMTPSNVKKGFFDTQSRLFAGCLADNAGKAKVPQQTAADSPKINAAKNSHQLQAVAKAPFGVQGFHAYPLSSQGTIYIASDFFNTGGANQVFANYGTYAHELADMVSGQTTGDETSFGDPPNDNNGGDTDSGAAVEVCMYGALQRP